MIRLGMNFVPILYRRRGKVGFLALLAERKINNLRGINTPLEFDSVPGHHLLSSKRLRRFRVKVPTRNSTLTSSKPASILRLFSSAEDGCDNAGIAASVKRRNHEKGLFIGDVDDDVIVHGLKSQRA